MTISTTVSLVDIEPDDTINARRTRTDEGIDELGASIRAHGLVQPLRVRRDDGTGKYKIIAGSRRYRVLCELAAVGETAAGVSVTPDFQVPVLIGEADDATAREISQAENFIRLPQHEADTYETFRELADAGQSEAEIAARFGIDPKRVRRMLALGRLSPVILEAWRDGTFEKFTGFNGTVANIVRAFTLAPSIEEQERVYHKLAKAGHLYVHTIKGEFGAGDRQIGKHLEFVGIATYVAAGGQVVEDLFGEDHAVSDPALVKKLVAEKLQAKVDEAIADGWSWACLADELPSNWSYVWQKLPVSKKKASKADKAKAGAVVTLSHQGKLEITYGVVKPEAEAKRAKAANGTKEKAEPTISNAMMHRLSIQVTQAAQMALSEEPRVGLVALLAGFFTRSDGPVKVHATGMGGTYGDRETFAAAFTRLSAAPDEELFRVAAGIAGHALDMQSQNALCRPLSKGGDVLAAAIDADRMTAVLRESFDAIDYFNGVSKPFVITAIREAVNEDEARKADKLKKKDLVEFAVKNVQDTGWLPPELRCATYSGPGEIPKAEAAPPIGDDPDFDEIDEEEQDEAA